MLAVCYKIHTIEIARHQYGQTVYFSTIGPTGLRLCRDFGRVVVNKLVKWHIIAKSYTRLTILNMTRYEQDSCDHNNRTRP